MNIGEAVKERILELCRERDISINKLCSMSGVTQSTVNNIISGRNRSATVSTVKKLCDGLGITHRGLLPFSVIPGFGTGNSIATILPHPTQQIGVQMGFFFCLPGHGESKRHWKSPHACAMINTSHE